MRLNDHCGAAVVSLPTIPVGARTRVRIRRWRGREQMLLQIWEAERPVCYAIRGREGWLR